MNKRLYTIEKLEELLTDLKTHCEDWVELQCNENGIPYVVRYQTQEEKDPEIELQKKKALLEHDRRIINKYKQVVRFNKTCGRRKRMSCSPPPSHLKHKALIELRNEANQNT
jgi:hypothetical protein